MKVNKLCLRRAVSRIMNDMGVVRGTVGRVLVRDSIMYSVLHEDFEIYPQIKEVYIEIGKKYYSDNNDDEKLYYKVEHTCRRAIESTYNKSPHTEMWDKTFSGYKPSASEFIRTCADMIVDGEILIDESADKFVNLSEEMKIYISSEVRKAIREFFHGCLDK